MKPDCSDEEQDTPDIEIIQEKQDYPWTDDREEWRRAFVFEIMGNGDFDARVLIENMEKVSTWLKTGKAPSRPNLKSV